MSVGLFLSSYAPSILFLYISYGLLLGIGTSLCATMALIVSADYFDKHLSLATGIVASGSSFGTLVFPPTLQILVERYGWQTTFRIMGLGGILMAITGLVYRSVNRNHVPIPANGNQFFDTSVLKNKAFVLWTIATTVAGFGYFIPHFFLVRKRIYILGKLSRLFSHNQVFHSSCSRKTSGILTSILGSLCFAFLFRESL